MSRCKLNPCCGDPAFCKPPPHPETTDPLHATTSLAEWMAEKEHGVRLRRLLQLYQDKLVDAINDQRHFDGERSGLRMAAALFRSCLAELEIPNG